MLWVEQDLGPAVLTVVEVLVALGGVVQVQLVRHDQAGVEPVAVDEVAQLPVVLLRVGLARAHRLALEEERAEVKSELAVPGLLGLGGRVLGDEDTDDADAPGGTDSGDEAVDRQAGLLVTRVVNAAAHLDDLAHVLVAEDLALLDVGAALVHVQVATADVRRRDLDQRIGRLLDLGVRNLVDRDVLRTVVHECTYGSLSFRSGQ